MSDYTEIFREFANSDTFVISRSLLEEYKQKAANAERERFIKLLEGFDPRIAIGDVLPLLIKGENK